ncbi:cis-prenyltransferase [Tulasnella sp. JGI-2019a]|nr:cis-prenyltransferase [Tulasnella sp. JGI-2019a]KAG9010735.1 cis-prenyltransferase [Tulasnella sp. JGI-2019a]KAG9031720.1 cis-prenyltransferase [Tulasnella sp. JGI-2019a]
MLSTGVAAWQWLVTLITDYFTRIICTILSSGPIPKHIAFVMDGNRRYARRRQERVLEGHTAGFYTLHRLLDVCLALNIRCVSVYAFSIENFKRPKEEVDGLMALAKDKLIEMSQKGEVLDRHQIRVNVVGRRDLLPLDVQETAHKVEEMTKHHDKAILNICMPYTSRDEMASAVETTLRDCREEFICPEDITESDIDKSLQSVQRHSPPLDVLIRTSGTYRLSDYFLWQVSEGAQLHFTATYWPDFGLRDLVPILFAYQRKAWSNAS